MATVQSADADGERELEGSFAGRELEVLDRDLSHAQAAGSDLLGGCGDRLLHGFGGPVDRKDVPPTDALRDRSCRGPRSTADLQNTHPRTKRKGLDDSRKTRGERRVHGM